MLGDDIASDTNIYDTFTPRPFYICIGTFKLTPPFRPVAFNKSLSTCTRTQLESRTHGARRTCAN